MGGLSDREVWIDAAKGIGISLVVIGHAWRGIDGAGLLEALPDGLFAAIDRRIYAFHMPLFFMLAGLFAVPAILRLSAGAYVSNRVWRLFYPLVLWTYIFGMTKYLAGDLANKPVSLHEVFLSPVPGRWQFWFLWALFVLQMGLFLLGPALREERRQGPVVWGLLLSSIAVQAVPLPHELHYWTSNALKYLPYMALGMVFARLGKACLQAERLGPIYLLIFSSMLMLVPTLEKSGIPYLMTAGLLSLSMIGGVIWWTSHYTALVATLAMIGRHSMIIFLSHTIFSAGMREALIASGVHAASIHMALATGVGVVMPLLLAHASSRITNTRILGV
jgi:fucose 4-O-acetylase-like acetyltransferase